MPLEICRLQVSEQGPGVSDDYSDGRQRPALQTATGVRTDLPPRQPFHSLPTVQPARKEDTVVAERVPLALQRLLLVTSKTTRNGQKEPKNQSNDMNF